MKQKGVIFILAGVLGIIFVFSFDKIAGKPINDISGPKSIIAIVVCGILVLLGLSSLFKKGSKQ
jgi:hypothetical protein